MNRKHSRWLVMLVLILSYAALPASSMVSQASTSTSSNLSLYSLPSITVDNANTSAISYGGAWTSAGYSNAMFNTLHLSGSSGNYAQFSFSGRAITYWYSMAYNRGSARIYLDGNYIETISAYAPEIRRQVGRTWMLPTEGSHTIKVEVVGDGFIDVDAFTSNIQYVDSAAQYDDSDPQTIIRYFPDANWYRATGVSGAYNNTLRWSGVATELLRFTFVGNSITYMFSKANNRGIAAITIDGEDKGYMDLYSYGLMRHLGVTYTGLAENIPHVINITVTNTLNPSSSNTFVDIDNFVLNKPLTEIYDRDKAVTYADEWARGRNTNNFPTYQWDCVSYLSQMLITGGIPMIGVTTQADTNWDWWYRCQSAGNCSGSITWQQVLSMNSHASAYAGQRFAYRYNGTDLTKGDFFFMDADPYDGKTEYTHARVIVGWGNVEEGAYAGQWHLLANSHSNDRRHIKWDWLVEGPNYAKAFWHLIY